MMKSLLQDLVAKAALWISRTSAGSYAFEQIVNALMSRQRVVSYRTNRMTFAVPNWLCRYRIDTFASKEPETLDWIDSIPAGSVLWDVGANIGLYAIYAATSRRCETYAFEPSVFNLELLARNVFLNNLQQVITIVPLALSDQRGMSLFKTSSTTWGGALSTFGQDFDQDGRPLQAIFEYRTMGISMTEAVDLLKIPMPRYIKIDVDGLEHFILKGAADVLAQADEVLIEVNDAFKAQAEAVAQLLAQAGLTLRKKCDLGHETTFNQWWTRQLHEAEMERT